MPVRQEQHVDAREVDGEPLGVGEPDITVRSDVEQHGCRVVSSSRGGEGREAVTRDAEVVEADNAVVPVVLAAGRDPAEQVRQFGKLRRAGSDARERVGCVVDDDRDGELVEFGCCVRACCHRSMLPAPAGDGLRRDRAHCPRPARCGSMSRPMANTARHENDIEVELLALDALARAYARVRRLPDGTTVPRKRHRADAESAASPRRERPPRPRQSAGTR